MQSKELASDPLLQARESLREAFTLLDQARLGAAARNCERALDLVPNWVEALDLYAAVMDQMGFVGKAGSLREKAASQDAVSHSVWENESVLTSRRFGAVEPMVRRQGGARGAGPNPAAQGLLEDACRAREVGKLGSALHKCEAALGLDPDWADAHDLRGVLLDDMGHAEKAITAYLEAIRLNPSHTGARRNLLQAGAALDDDGFSGLIVVRRFSFPSEAEVAQRRLEAEGFPACVLQADIVTMNWLFSNMVGGVKLCVREEDAEEALVVLDWDLTTPEPGERCPKCGSVEVRYEKYNLRWVYAIILLFKIPLPIKKERWTCRRCGASWKDEQVENQQSLWRG